MAKLILTVLVVAVVVGGAYAYLNLEIKLQRDDAGQLQQITVTPRSERAAALFSGSPAARPARPRIRIATFNLDRLNEQKFGNRQVNDVLVRMLPKFDLIAVQDIRARNLGLLTTLVEQINATGRRYNFATCPTVRRDAVSSYSAFIYDEIAVEIDLTTVHSLEDPDGRFLHRPLVALFRTKEPKQAEAFTFELVNFHIDPSRVAVEEDLLDDVYRAVRDGAPHEDDIILLGDFGTDVNGSSSLGKIPDITSSISGTPTTIRGTRPVDNIVFDRRATVEFTGKAEVLDLMREFELTASQAREVSNHMPVWAEFSSYEGGSPGRVADETTAITR